MTHPYIADKHSGAGNCECGAARRHRRHPHEFARARGQEPAGSATLCVCALRLDAEVHHA